MIKTRQKTTAVAVVKTRLPAVAKEKKTRISKLKNVAKMKSIIGDSAEKVHQLLEVGDNDSATALIMKSMLQALIDIIPHAESNVRKTKGARGVYQINSLISSVREIMIDLQSLQDKGAIGEALIEKIIRPCFLDIGMHIVQEYSSIAAEAKAVMSIEDYRAFKNALSTSRGNISEFIQKEYGKVKEDAKAFLQR